MPSVDTSRQRLRFEALRHDVAPDGRCRVSAELEWAGRTFVGSCEGIETHQGRIRAAACATLEAATAAAGPGLTLDLMGVKAVRAFDGWVVVARVNGTNGRGTYRLLGSAAAEGEETLLLASAQAVLDATNRVMERQVKG